MVRSSACSCSSKGISARSPLFLPPADQPDLPALILEAQMAADPEVAGGGDLASRELNFGDPTRVREFEERRVEWIEQLPERLT